VDLRRGGRGVSQQSDRRDAAVRRERAGGFQEIATGHVHEELRFNIAFPIVLVLEYPDLRLRGRGRRGRKTTDISTFGRIIVCRFSS